MSPEKPIFILEASSVSIDLTSPELGRELLKNAKGDLPIDAWRQYVLNHSYSPDPAKPWADVIYWCDQAYRSTLDPRTAVDDAFGILAGLLFCSPKRSYDELVKGIWEALSVLHEAPTRDSGYKGTASAVAELVDNALQAGATRIGVSVVQAEGDANSLILEVSDNGCGMAASGTILATSNGGGA